MLCQRKLISLLIVTKAVGKTTSQISKRYFFKYQNYSYQFLVNTPTKVKKILGSEGVKQILSVKDHTTVLMQYTHCL
jgi:hypothetical protein